MELGLSLGDASAFIDEARHLHRQKPISGNDLGFCIGLSIGPTPRDDADDEDDEEEDSENGIKQPPIQLDLLPNTPVPRHPHPSSGSSEAGSSGQIKGVDVNKVLGAAAEEAMVSSPNSPASSHKRDSDEDETGNTRKKLRLSKEQSVFLEESFKEHNTLNPKQKLALAKQLNLLPRQVEVWFQNRRARTKSKQNEVECDYLKRCCETLTEENRRLQKELQELRAFKTSNPFYMQLPATTLTMCPSCERVAANTATAPPGSIHVLKPKIQG